MENDCTPDDTVAFLIGCSFSCDAALMNAGIKLRFIEEKKNIQYPCIIPILHVRNQVNSMATWLFNETNQGCGCDQGGIDHDQVSKSTQWASLYWLS